MTASPAAPPPNSVAVVSGGVGAARFLRGLIEAIDPSRIVAVVNTGDDTTLHGLSISPDLDTITYTLAGAIDPERGWGLADETWRAIGALERYEAVRPEGSGAAARWFNLGDQDLATHFYRTARLQEGASLTEVTDEITRAWGLPIRVVPMSDDRLATLVTLESDEGGPGGEVSFQDYFVRLRHSVPVTSVRFAGDARPSDVASTALRDASAVVIAPSNPLVSIGPIRSLPGFDEQLNDPPESVVGVTTRDGGPALKGPADRMLTELGHRADAVGVARLYAPIAASLVIDEVDAHLVDDVSAEGVRPVVADTIMSRPGVARSLAVTTLSAAGVG
ncbi:MAG: 2-phospho-L-lactate transferase [Actinomycetota bacterium]